MKKIIKILLFLHLFSVFNLYANFTICDSGNIDFSGKNISEICNGGLEYNNVSLINEFIGTNSDTKLGYWGNIFNYKLGNLLENNPNGFFDNYKKTVISKVNPYLFFNTGFIGSNNKLNKDHFNGIIPNGFFDNIRKTKILKNNINYDFSIGVIKNNNIVLNNIKNNKKTFKKRKKITKTYTYEVFIKNILKENSNIDFLLSGYHYYEYNRFIDNLFELYLDGNSQINDIVSNLTTNRINLYIEKTNEFKYKLKILTKNLRKINNGFLFMKTKKERNYIIKNILNSDG